MKGGQKCDMKKVRGSINENQKKKKRQGPSPPPIPPKCKNNQINKKDKKIKKEMKYKNKS